MKGISAAASNVISSALRVLAVLACGSWYGPAAAAVQAKEYRPPAGMSTPQWDPKGYILGPHCGGRFGNQFDQLLGFVEYAKKVDRTAVLGPWVEYQAREETGEYPYFPAFKDFFSVDALNDYHRVIDLEDFLHFFGPRWKEAGVWGWSKHGKPFEFHPEASSLIQMDFDQARAPFWERTFRKADITGFERLIKSEVHSELDVAGGRAIEHPVWAVECMPGAYPAPLHMDSIARHFVWSGIIAERAERFVNTHLQRPFVAVHYRNEFGDDAEFGLMSLDGKRKCYGFSTVQCAQYASGVWVGDHTPSTTGDKQLPLGACFPTLEQATAALDAQFNGIGANKKDGRVLYVASDRPLEKLASGLKGALKQGQRAGLKVVTLPGGTGVDALFRPQLDLAILSMADAVIAHCPSSFSNVATRIRKWRGVEAGGALPTGYWGLPVTYLSDVDWKEL